MATERASTYVQVMVNEDMSWQKGARCNFPNAWAMWTIDADKTKATAQKREWAAAQCTQCPVQWRCAEFAIDTMDLWNICAVYPDEREYLEKRPDWRELLIMASDAGMPVAELVRNLQTAVT